MGIQVEALPDGRVRIRVSGAKVRADRGQPWREIVEDPRAALGHELGHALWKRLGEVGGAIEVRIEPAGHAFQDRVSRLARRLGFRGISAYSFRHQMSADLKALVAGGQLSGVEASAALGHASARMRKHYGTGASLAGAAGERPRSGQPVRCGPDTLLSALVPGRRPESVPLVLVVDEMRSRMDAELQRFKSAINLVEFAMLTDMRSTAARAVATPYACGGPRERS